MIYLFLFGLSLASLLYWAYKMFRAAPYQPGNVAKMVAEDPLLGYKTREDLTNSNNTKDNETFWSMPNGMNLFYFAPSKTTSSTSQRRPVLALHGGPAMAPSEPWKAFSKEIPDFYLYHCRGAGKSTRPFHDFPTKKMWPGIQLLEQELGVAQQILDIERIRHKLTLPAGRDQTVDLIGHSFGGFVATMYACEFPQHVRSLTLLVPATVLELPPPNPEHDFFKVIETKLEGSDLRDFQAFLKRYLDFSKLPQQTEETLAQNQAEFAIHYGRAAAANKDEAISAKPPPLPVDPALVGGMTCYATFLSLGMEHNYISACQERLASSTFPVAIVHGGDDLMPPEVSQVYTQLFPAENVTFEVLPEVAHFSYDHPRVAEILQSNMNKAST